LQGALWQRRCNAVPHGKLKVMTTKILIATAALLVILLVWLRASLHSYTTRGEKLLAIFLLGLLPAAWALAVVCSTMVGMTQVEFCAQCHTMDDYIESLDSSDPDSLPANHVQNNRVKRETACYDCHAVHTTLGAISVKLSGLRHLWVTCFRPPPEEIHLSKPYNTAICLHCHEGAKNFEEAHDDGEDQLQQLHSGELSCLDCHDVAHVVKKDE